VDLFLDDDPKEATFAENETVQEVLLHIQADMCTPDAVIVGIRCDGTDVPSGEMAELLTKPASSLKRLEVFTGARHQLVLDAMEQAATCLADSDADCQRIAGLLTEGNIVEAAEGLGHSLRAWQQIHDAVGKSIEMLQLDASQNVIHEEPLAELMSKPREVLTQIRDALRVSDYVVLADILQYEFHDVTDKWQSIIAMLRQAAEKQGTSPNQGFTGQ